MNIGMATGIRAISVTHCGELGWVIYIPNEVKRERERERERVRERERSTEVLLQHG